MIFMIFVLLLFASIDERIAAQSGDSVKWVLGPQSDGNCEKTCATMKGTCDENIGEEAASAPNSVDFEGIECKGRNGWDYGQGFSQCLDKGCCGDSSCQFHCSATSRWPGCKIDDRIPAPHHGRLCPCRIQGLPSKRPIPQDTGYSNCGAGYYDAQGLGQPLDYCRWVGNGGCRKDPSWWSCALAGHSEQYTEKGEYSEPNIVCPDGWSRHKQKCYKFFNTKTSWKNAQDECNKIGSDLASIESKEATDFVTKNLLSHLPDDHTAVHPQVYIGGHQFKEGEYSKKHWAWADWSPFWYTNWANNPEDWMNEEDCMSMLLKNFALDIRGKWNDVPCTRDNWFPYICSRSITTVRSTSVLNDMAKSEDSFLIWPDSLEEKFVTLDPRTEQLTVSNLEAENVEKDVFIFRNGLCGKENTISIESELYPGKFWRHQNAILKLHPDDGTNLFKQDSCFEVVKIGCREGSFALRSTNYPEHFIQMGQSSLKLKTTSKSTEKMCWANPVSLQLKLAYCDTSIEKEDDLYNLPECCNHIEILEKFGRCCSELLKEDGDTCTSATISSLGVSPSLLYLCQPLFTTNDFFEFEMNRKLKSLPFCCDPNLQKHDKVGLVQTLCSQTDYGSGNVSRKKRATLKCGMRCREINHCPKKMRKEKGWTNKDDRCCCHPYRKNVMKGRNHAHLNDPECVAEDYPSIYRG